MKRLSAMTWPLIFSVQRKRLRVAALFLLTCVHYLMGPTLAQCQLAFANRIPEGWNIDWLIIAVEIQFRIEHRCYSGTGTSSTLVKVPQSTGRIDTLRLLAWFTETQARDTIDHGITWARFRTTTGTASWGLFRFQSRRPGWRWLLADEHESMAHRLSPAYAGKMCFSEPPVMKAAYEIGALWEACTLGERRGLLLGLPIMGTIGPGGGLIIASEVDVPSWIDAFGSAPEVKYCEHDH